MSGYPSTGLMADLRRLRLGRAGPRELSTAWRQRGMSTGNRTDECRPNTGSRGYASSKSTELSKQSSCTRGTLRLEWMLTSSGRTLPSDREMMVGDLTASFVQIVEATDVPVGFDTSFSARSFRYSIMTPREVR